MARTQVFSIWKCQACGLTFERSSKGEPKSCPICRDKGSKSFIHYERWVFEPGSIVKIPLKRLLND